MKNIEVTYDVLMLYGIRKQGEAAFILQVEDALAAEYLTGKADYGAVNLVETALEAVEAMRGRVYVRGSIKDIREAK